MVKARGLKAHNPALKSLSRFCYKFFRTLWKCGLCSDMLKHDCSLNALEIPSMWHFINLKHSKQVYIMKMKNCNKFI